MIMTEGYATWFSYQKASAMGSQYEAMKYDEATAVSGIGYSYTNSPYITYAERAIVVKYDGSIPASGGQAWRTFGARLET